jgi:transcription factor TFIIIB component B''
MTGKDFSGPTPVIRAPTPLTLKQPENVESSEISVFPQKQRGSLEDDMDEEIVGDVDSFDLSLRDN